MISPKLARLSPSLTLALMALLTIVGGCSSERRHSGVASERSIPADVQVVDRCATPNDECDCPSDGTVVDCGRVTERYADYVTCSQGTRTCTAGKWGACVGERIVQKDLPAASSSGSSLLALGSAGQCPAGFDPCDPFCHQVVDRPGGFDAGSGFNNTPTELKPKHSVRVGCSLMTITPSATTITVTQISPVVTTPATVTITATMIPPCVAVPFATTWTIDRFDIGQITGSNSANGVLSVVSPSVGDVRVTAHAAGLSASATIQVKVNALQTATAAIAPNKVATNPHIALFGTASVPLPGLGASTANWLYPYAQTYFPLGLPAPVMQYRYTTTGTQGAVKVSLRYPVNQTATGASFNYSIIVSETASNVVSQTAAVAANNIDPQLVIPQAAWRAFEQTARGNNADILIQRLRSGTTLETENRRAIRLVDGQLKGTVYYNSYSSPLGNNTGAVLSIAPGATTPTLAVQPGGKCTVCHSVNLDGTKMIAAGDRPTGGVTFNNSRRYSIPAGAPSPTILNDYNAASGDVENIPGNRFNFGGSWKDGTLYMTHGGGSPTTSFGGDNNWRSPPDYSRLYNPATPTTVIPVTGWTNISAVTPRFSADGTKLAFGFWGGRASSSTSSTPSTLAQLPTGTTLASDPGGDTLAVVDFKCSTPTCTGSSTGWNVSNARNLTPAVTHKVAWPTFTPDGDAVLYQRQYRSAKALFDWSASDVNTIAGALAEVWMSNVPPNKNTAAVPTQLRALNGVNPAPATTSYLPSITPYHTANASFTINQADNCSVSDTATGVNDSQLNYLPWIAPSEVGGFHWVVFTSRRMYGNVAYNDPWDAEPGYSCYSGQPPAKKLWIAALDKDFVPGTDPSHPAFYLPGQELQAGNSDGYWVTSPCVGINAVCGTNDDCCGGTGASPTTRCDAIAKTCKAITTCISNGGNCTATTDCCAGLVCGGTGKCINPEYFAPQTYTREYVASCPDGTRPVWRFFEWQSSIPTGSAIAITVKTKRTAASTWSPATALALGSITASTPAGVWAHGTKTVDQVLIEASPPLASQDYLLVSLTFDPDATGLAAPSLQNWRQNYDCVDSE